MGRIPRLDMVPPGKRKDTRKRDRSSEPWRKSYSTGRYRDARQAAIYRTRGRCAVCGKTVAHFDGGRWVCDSGEVHHIHALCDGGTDAPPNLMLVCPTCHRKLDAQRRDATR